jgi:transcriptional regulator GlxA family with amidase domain
MTSRLTIHSNWLSELSEEFPQSAAQIDALTVHVFAKQEKLAVLIQFCAAHPKLHMMRMYAEYSAALDIVTLGSPELSQESTASARHHTRRTRTHTAILDVAETLIQRDEPWNRDKLANLANISPATLYNHFASTSHIIVEAYERMLAA